MWFRKKKTKNTNKITVKRDDLTFLNELTSKSDNSRSKLSSVLITVYGAVTSGLFFLVSGSELALDANNKRFFVIVVISSVLIVFTALLEKVFDYFALVQVGKNHVKNIKDYTTYSQTGHYNKLSPNTVTSLVLSAIPVSQLILLIVNALSVLFYILTSVKL
jgi:hypothetical protein